MIPLSLMTAVTILVLSLQVLHALRGLANLLGLERCIVSVGFLDDVPKKPGVRFRCTPCGPDLTNMSKPSLPDDDRTHLFGKKACSPSAEYLIELSLASFFKSSVRASSGKLSSFAVILDARTPVLNQRFSSFEKSFGTDLGVSGVDAWTLTL